MFIMQIHDTLAEMFILFLVIHFKAKQEHMHVLKEHMILRCWKYEMMSRRTNNYWKNWRMKLEDVEGREKYKVQKQSK